MQNSAIYPGSFDPVTNGHLDVIERATKLFSTVIVAVASNPEKTGLFTPPERVELIERATSHLPSVRVTHFQGLLVDFAQQEKASAFIRGIRAISDWEAEFQMGQANRQLAPGVETVFLFPEPEEQFISSSLIKEIASHGGAFERYVPEPVAKAMKDRYAAMAEES